jgi:hypothetical protein
VQLPAEKMTKNLVHSPGCYKVLRRIIILNFAIDNGLGNDILKAMKRFWRDTVAAVYYEQNERME